MAGSRSEDGGAFRSYARMTFRLSKSRFTSGLQCHKKLWWEVHEPDAIELQPDKVLQDLFDQGRQVGEAARARYPGGVLIDLPHHAGAERVAATQKALAPAGPGRARVAFLATREARPPLGAWHDPAALTVSEIGRTHAF